MDEPSRLTGIMRAATYFVVARNLPRKDGGESGTGHYRPLLAALDQFEWPDRSSGYADSVNRFEALVQQAYGMNRRVRSLASKFLWLKFQQGVVIYDSQARIALDLPENVTLERYEMAWKDQYRKNQSAIVEACEDLAKVLRFAPNHDGVPPAELKETLQAGWFHERVLDVALWSGRGSRVR